jgi:hypothetical protein
MGSTTKFPPIKELTESNIAKIIAAFNATVTNGDLFFID